MKSVFRPSTCVVLAASIAACDGNSESLYDSGESRADVVLTEISDVQAVDEILDVELLQDVNVTPRSPQGIPDRRRGRRDERSQRPRRSLVDEREVRAIDGVGNNISRPEWGAAFIHLQRMAPANYSDGVSSMIFTDRSGPREISNSIVAQSEGESMPNPVSTSDFTWQWGQFIDHDLDLTDGAAEAENIAVPVGDPYFDPDRTGTAVIPFNRALFDPETGTDTSNVREQENEITAWMDGSMVYGSTDERAEALRVGPESPFLATSPGNLLPFNAQELVNANGPVADPSSLFLAGDIRANEQVGLATLHTLFVREHNRLAQRLMDANPQSEPEAIFQAARRLVIATIQKITFDEHLPALIGPNTVPEYTGYDSTLNPSIYNEFSAAAFRLGHSMVSENLQRIGRDGESDEKGPLALRDAFFTAPLHLQSETDIDPILRGLASQVHQTVDVKVIHTLRNFLFGAPGSGGLDLISLNIQRGRDHGLPYYNDMRVALGLEPIISFDQISDDAELTQSLQDAYGDVSRIDLWIGGLAERPLLEIGSQLGELFTAIVARQFTELRDADRFWYEHDLTAAELDRIEHVTLARVIRNNTGIGDELQDNVFLVPDLIGSE